MCGLTMNARVYRGVLQFELSLPVRCDFWCLFRALKKLIANQYKDKYNQELILDVDVRTLRRNGQLLPTGNLPGM